MLAKQNLQRNLRKINIKVLFFNSLSVSLCLSVSLSLSLSVCVCVCVCVWICLPVCLSVCLWVGIYKWVWCLQRIEVSVLLYLIFQTPGNGVRKLTLILCKILSFIYLWALPPAPKIWNFSKLVLIKHCEWSLILIGHAIQQHTHYSSL